MAKNTRVLESPKQDTQPPLNEQIAQRAYQYWEERGREDGYDLEDWLRAEQELSPRSAFGQPSAK